MSLFGAVGRKESPFTQIIYFGEVGGHRRNWRGRYSCGNANIQHTHMKFFKK